MAVFQCWVSGGILALAHKEYHGACQLQQQIGCRTLEEMNKMQVMQKIAGASNGAWLGASVWSWRDCLIKRCDNCLSAAEQSLFWSSDEKRKTFV